MTNPFPSFHSLRERYFNDLRVKNWSEGTIDRRLHSLRRFVAWLQDRGIDTMLEVTPEIIESYQRSLFHIGNLKTRQPLRFATQASYLSAVSHWFNWACMQQIIPFNPAVSIELPKEEKRLPSAFLNQDEIEKLINMPDITNKIGVRDRAILEVLYSTAMRRSELAKLTHNDIDRSRRLIVIRQGKGKKDRVVPVGVRALQWLDKYVREVRDWLTDGHGARIRLTIKPSDFVFLNNCGRPFGLGPLSTMVRDYLKEAEIKKLGGCHIIRHTTATLMLENGADLRSIQTLLGHESLNTTQIYTHITIDRLREVHDLTHPAKPDTVEKLENPATPNSNPTPARDPKPLKSSDNEDQTGPTDPTDPTGPIRPS